MTLFQYGVIGTVLSFFLIPFGYAKATPIQFGDSQSQLGELEVSGFVRAKYQDKSWTNNDHKLTFDAARLNLDYRYKAWSGHVEYRCYQFSQLCDFNALVDAYIGYQFNETNYIQLGIQNIPFGPSRFWESNNYGGILTQIGLEDVHNTGVSIHIEPFEKTQIDVGYFPIDGGSYHGSSVDAARYSTNFVKPSQIDQTYLTEKNMWIGRIKQDLGAVTPAQIKTAIGGSLWFADIENKTNQQTGDRHAWSIFSNLAYENINFMVIAGESKIKNKDPNDPNQSIVGSFDNDYWIANKSRFYTADIRYTLKNIDFLDTVTPYAMYSAWIKNDPDAKHSTRTIVGVALDYQKMTIVADYIMAKNDFLIGGNEFSYAKGQSSKMNKMLNLQFIYNF